MACDALLAVLETWEITQVHLGREWEPCLAQNNNGHNEGSYHNSTWNILATS